MAEEKKPAAKKPAASSLQPLVNLLVKVEEID